MREIRRFRWAARGFLAVAWCLAAGPACDKGRPVRPEAAPTAEGGSAGEATAQPGNGNPDGEPEAASATEATANAENGPETADAGVAEATADAGSGPESTGVTEGTAGASDGGEASRPDGAGGGERPEVGGTGAVADECGHYRVDVELPEQFACAEDDDCGWVEHRPGQCRDPLCTGDYVAGNRAWVAAAEALFRRVCGDRRYEICERVRCLHRKPVRAVCREGRCGLEFE